eukprot:1714791-Pleurochrysis_carterae.AAC.2
MENDPKHYIAHNPRARALLKYGAEAHRCQPAGAPRQAFKHCRRQYRSLGSSTAMSEEKVP